MSDYQLREGYKQTEIGVIPEDWEVKKVLEIGSVKGGKRLPKGSLLIDTPNPYPYIRVADMYDGGINTSDIKYAPEEVAPTIKNYRIYSTDIFISVAGTLGIIGKIPEELNGANLTENANRITDISCDKDFLLYTLMLERIQNEIDAQKTIGAQPKLALGRIENFKLAIPNSCEEQRSLSQALSDVDALISALDKLVAKKRDLKTATMQQLLTGKKRLPGFGEGQGYKESAIGLIPEDWEVIKLAAILKIRHGKSQREVVDPNGIYPILGTGGEIGKTNIPLYAEPSVLIGRKGTIDSPRYMDTPFWTVDTLFYSEIFKNTDAKFVFYKFNLIDWYSYNEASGVPSLNAATIENIEQAFPILKEEQSAIALVLSDMDNAISLLESRLAKTKAIKQGMMQELLTGRTRLI